MNLPSLRPSFNSCSAPAKFSTRSSKGGWKPSSSRIRTLQLRSNQPPNQMHTTTTTPPTLSLSRPSSRSRGLSSRLKLPADPPRALPGRRPLPLPAAPHVLGVRVAAGLKHPASARRSALAALPSRPGQPQAEEAQARLPGCPTVRREDALFGAGLRSPLTRPLCSEPVSHCRPSQSRPGLRPALGLWAAAREPRRPRPPPGRLPSSPPHPDPPAAPFLTGGRAGFAGRREPTRSAASPAPGPAVSAASESSGCGRLGVSRSP